MNGEGFAFAAWVRTNIQTGAWITWDGAHGWHCSLCRRDWWRLQITAAGKSEGTP